MYLVDSVTAIMAPNRASSRLWAAKVNTIAASPLVTGAQRVRMWRRAGMTIGDDVDLRPHCWVFNSLLEIGDGTLISYGCSIENREQVTIGAGCSIAQQVTIVTSTHRTGSRERRAGAYAGSAVSIGAGCWVGARAVILAGADISPGCIIGAGAVVPAGVYEADRTYVGVPARELGLLVG